MVGEAKDVGELPAVEQHQTLLGFELREGERPLEEADIEDLKMVRDVMDVVLKTSKDARPNVHNPDLHRHFLHNLDDEVRRRVVEREDEMTLPSRIDKLTIKESGRILDMLHDGGRVISGQLRERLEEASLSSEQRAALTLLGAGEDVVQAAFCADYIGVLCRDEAGVLSLPQSALEGDPNSVAYLFLRLEPSRMGSLTFESATAPDKG